MLDTQTTSAVLLGTIGLISALGLIGTVLAFWSMGRAAYRNRTTDEANLYVDDLDHSTENPGSTHEESRPES